MLRLLRRPDRKLSSIKAQLRMGERWTEITLANVSSHGLMTKGAPQLPIGSLVEIRRRSVTINGQVMWATPTRLGVRAFEKIDLPALMATSELQPDRRRGEEDEHRECEHADHRTAPAGARSSPTP